MAAVQVAGCVNLNEVNPTNKNIECNGKEEKPLNGKVHHSQNGYVKSKLISNGVDRVEHGAAGAADGVVAARHLPRLVRGVLAADGGAHARRPLPAHVPGLRQPAALQAQRGHRAEPRGLRTAVQPVRAVLLALRVPARAPHLQPPHLLHARRRAHAEGASHGRLQLVLQVHGHGEALHQPRLVQLPRLRGAFGRVRGRGRGGHEALRSRPRLASRRAGLHASAQGAGGNHCQVSGRRGGGGVRHGLRDQRAGHPGADGRGLAGAERREQPRVAHPGPAPRARHRARVPPQQPAAPRGAGARGHRRGPLEEDHRDGGRRVQHGGLHSAAGGAGGAQEAVRPAAVPGRGALRGRHGRARARRAGPLRRAGRRRGRAHGHLHQELRCRRGIHRRIGEAGVAGARARARARVRARHGAGRVRSGAGRHARHRVAGGRGARACAAQQHAALPAPPARHARRGVRARGLARGAHAGVYVQQDGGHGGAAHGARRGQRGRGLPRHAAQQGAHPVLPVGGALPRAAGPVPGRHRGGGGGARAALLPAAALPLALPFALPLARRRHVAAATRTIVPSAPYHYVATHDMR